jgi:hypothetical protein
VPGITIADSIRSESLSAGRQVYCV